MGKRVAVETRCACCDLAILRRLCVPTGFLLNACRRKSSVTHTHTHPPPRWREEVVVLVAKGAVLNGAWELTLVDIGGH